MNRRDREVGVQRRGEAQRLPSGVLHLQPLLQPVGAHRDLRPPAQLGLSCPHGVPQYHSARAEPMGAAAPQGPAAPRCLAEGAPSPAAAAHGLRSVRPALPGAAGPRAVTFSRNARGKSLSCSGLGRSASVTVSTPPPATSKAELRAKPCCASGPKPPNCGKHTGTPPRIALGGLNTALLLTKMSSCGRAPLGAAPSGAFGARLSVTSAWNIFVCPRQAVCPYLAGRRLPRCDVRAVEVDLCAAALARCRHVHHCVRNSDAQHLVGIQPRGWPGCSDVRACSPACVRHMLQRRPAPVGPSAPLSAGRSPHPPRRAAPLAFARLFQALDQTTHRAPMTEAGWDSGFREGLGTLSEPVSEPCCLLYDRQWRAPGPPEEPQDEALGCGHSSARCAHAHAPAVPARVGLAAAARRRRRARQAGTEPAFAGPAHAQVRHAAQLRRA